MGGRFLRRAGALALTTLCASALSFVLLAFAPGDRARMVANARHGGDGAADPVIVEAIRMELGLDRPLLSQFAAWLVKALQLDFGVSFVNYRSVADIAAQALATTVPLALSAFALGVTLAAVLAFIAVIRPRSAIDRAIVAVASLVSALPSFCMGLLLILVFSVVLGWLPAYGQGTIWHAALPAVTLSAWLIASKTRLFRNFLREALSAPYLDALRVRGVGEGTLLVRHVLRHVMVASVPVLCLDLAILLEGAVIVETVFARPGVGVTLLGALQARDYPVVQCLIVAAGIAYTVANLLADALAFKLDPRLRQPGGQPND
jgi:peptide/nickel transport system permease protein